MALGYDLDSQTANCPGCSQRVPVQVTTGRRGRIDSIKLSAHAKPDADDQAGHRDQAR